VRETIGQRKLEEEWNRYEREMRDEAYVDIRTDDGKPADATGTNAAPASPPPTTPAPPAGG